MAQEPLRDEQYDPAPHWGPGSYWHSWLENESGKNGRLLLYLEIVRRDKTGAIIERLPDHMCGDVNFDGRGVAATRQIMQQVLLRRLGDLQWGYSSEEYYGRPEFAFQRQLWVAEGQ